VLVRSIHSFVLDCHSLLPICCLRSDRKFGGDWLPYLTLVGTASFTALSRKSAQSVAHQHDCGAEKGCCALFVVLESRVLSQHRILQHTHNTTLRGTANIQNIYYYNYAHSIVHPPPLHLTKPPHMSERCSSNIRLKTPKLLAVEAEDSETVLSTLVLRETAERLGGLSIKSSLLERLRDLSIKSSLLDTGDGPKSESIGEYTASGVGRAMVQKGSRKEWLRSGWVGRLRLLPGEGAVAARVCPLRRMRCLARGSVTSQTRSGRVSPHPLSEGYYKLARRRASREGIMPRQNECRK
jgi:hypothetical protein